MFSFGILKTIPTYQLLVLRFLLGLWLLSHINIVYGLSIPSICAYGVRPLEPKVPVTIGKEVTR